MIQGSPPSKSNAQAEKRGSAQGQESPATVAARAMQVSSAVITAPETKWASPLKQPLLEGLPVSYDPPEGSLATPLCSGLTRLRNASQLCDAVVVTGDERRQPVHRVVLAASSEAFSSRFQGESAELDLKTYSQEAVDLLVRWLYGEVDAGSYAPSEDVNEEVLRLAHEFQLQPLSELCALKLAANVEVKNVVARVRLCEEFGLARLRAALVATLCEDRQVLDAVARDPNTLTHPALMRELLAAIAKQATSQD